MKESNIKVSVTVPVYNTEEYLPKCLDSLIGQTLKDLEIILVDDGSTDRSGAICDEYAKRDSRIKVFHKLNGGSASARQVGLENSHGLFYIICDSDDWIEPSMYEEMYNNAMTNKVDMVICDFCFNYPDGRQIQHTHSFKDHTQATLIKGVLMGKVAGSTCNKLTRLSVYKDNGLTWLSGINLGEDAFMLLQQLKIPITFSYLPKAFYHYRRIFNGTSYTNNATFETFKKSEYVMKWKEDNYSLYRRELFIGALSVAFQGLRVNNMPKKYLQDFLYKKVKYRLFIRYKVCSLKSIIVFIAKINYPLAKFMFKCSYKLFYK